MSRVQGDLTQDMQTVTGIESRLASTLSQTADELAHSDCLDNEQRSEVYAIIETLQADTKVHKKTIKLLGCQLTEGKADA